MDQTVKIKARVENYYVATDDEIVTEPEAELPLPPVPLPAPGTAEPQLTDAQAAELSEWLDVELFGMTGVGRTKGDAMYDLEVVASSRPDLVPVGYCHDWGY